MKPIFDIFSKKVSKEKKQEKIKITADYREKNSLVISKLLEAGIEVEMKELKVADYLANGVAIERKTISDFIASMLNGRLQRQLEEIQQYENKLLLIEGIEEQELYSDKMDNLRFPSEAIREIAPLCREGKCARENRRLSSNSIRGFLLSILLRHKVPIIFTKDAEDSAKFIELIARKKKRSLLPTNIKKKSLNKKERMQYILEGFPGIGPKTAVKLLEKFKSIKNIMNAPIEEIQKEIGKKSEIFKLLEEQY
jgi:Fanconi anemia group M protein